MDRREFLTTVGGGMLSARIGRWGPAPGPRSTVARAKVASSLELATRAAIQRLGGMSHFVPRGSRVVIKPNASWARSVAVCANTHPEVVAAIASMALEAGAADVRIVEHAVDGQDAGVAFEASGMKDVAALLRIPGYPVMAGRGFVPVKIPQGLRLKSAHVIREITEADVVINVPIAKSHSVTRYTGALKNWMGIVQDRTVFHAGAQGVGGALGHSLSIGQCCADVHTRIRPALNVLDASRVMATNGPEGPGSVIEPGEILASTDPVAIDAYGCRLLGIDPRRLEVLGLAANAGLGQRNLEQIDVVDA
jgi:uncharacterized protein (DUF362 family)